MNKILFSLFVILGFNVCDHAVSSSEDCAPSSLRVISSSKDFPYQKEVFELYQTSDIMSDSPSFEDVKQDAFARLTHLTALFDFVRENKLNKNVLNLFRNDTDFLNAYRQQVFGQSVSRHQKFTPTLDPKLIVLSRLKTDYAIERDLVSYFSKCLENFSQDRPSLEQIQNLYEQSVYVVRLNMQSLVDRMFNHMMLAYPQNFIKTGVDQEQMVILKDNLSVFGEEDTHYYDYFNTYAGIDFIRDNTVDITKRVRFLLKTESLKNSRVISELNSILFYLNIERALLSFCPDLTFDPDHYPLEKKTRGLQEDRFILSKLINFHETGCMASIVNQQYVDIKKSQLLTSPKMVSTLLSTSAEKEIDFFLSKIFPQEVSQKSTSSSVVKAASRHDGPRPKRKGSAQKRKQVQSKKMLGAGVPPLSQKRSVQIPVSSSSSAPLILNDVDSLEEEHITLYSDFDDILPARGQRIEQCSSSSSVEESQDEDLESLLLIDSTIDVTTSLDAFSEAKSSYQECQSYDDVGFRSSVSRHRPLKAKSPRVQTPKAPYQARLSYDDYVYKRTISTRTIPTYRFDGEDYSFKIRPFNLETIKEIKELTHHASERLPNVASYTLRIHGRDKEGQFFQDLVSPDIYLSGGHYFDRERDRLNLNVQNAYHTILTHSQQDSFKQSAPQKRGLYLGKILENEVRQKIVGGGWKDNCVDSEAIILLDIFKKMPRYLRSLAQSNPKDLEIMAVSLGISTYYDVCWRCRNLLQGWQWGLKDFITYVRPDMKISPDFSTLVMAFGEVRPHSHEADLHLPRLFDTQVILEPARPHKLAAVRMRR